MILVTSGTSFVGRHLIRELAENSKKVVAFIPQAAKRDDIEYLINLGAKIQYGHINDESSVIAAVKGCEAVFHIDDMVKEVKGLTYERIHVEGTRNVIEACRKCKVKKLIYLSSLGATFYANNRYHRSKCRAEGLVKRSGMDYTIWRPSLVFGPGDSYISVFTELIRKHPVVPVIDVGARLQPIYVEDLVTCMVKALKGKKNRRKVIEIGGPNRLTVDQIFDLAMYVMGVRRIKSRLPLLLTRLFAAASVPHRDPRLSMDMLRILQTESTCDISHVKKDFSITPTPMEDALRRFLA